MPSSTIRSSSVGPTLLTLLLCLFLLLHEASSYNLTLADLPLTKQHGRRLLAAITVNENVTSYFVTKQLLSYAEACEAGFEVHVVLITFPGVWDAADQLLFPTPTRYYCLRLQMLLPVVVASDLPFPLAYSHRLVFTQLAHKYDLFLSQEHDMDIRPRHLLYWTHWRHFFAQHASVPRSDRPIVPGFMRHEVSMRSHEGMPKLWLQPSPLIHIDYPLSLISIGNVTCIAPYKAYLGWYIIDRPMLQLAMSKQSWTTDAWKQYPEYNTHHQSHWQWYYFHQAIPLASMHEALVHHGADKYAPAFIEESAGYSDSQFREGGMEGGADPQEIQFLLTNCLGQRWDEGKMPFPYPSLRGSNTVVGYGACGGWMPRWLPTWFHAATGCLGYNPDPKGGKASTPCAECVRQGKGAAVVYRLSGPTLAARPFKRKATFIAEVSCVDAVEQQMLVRCTNEGCDDYQINASGRAAARPGGGG